MIDTFNLVTEPWIPVVDLETGRQAYLGLAEVLDRAHRLRLGTDSVETVVVLRVLLAVFDAAAGPTDTTEWTEAWHADALDADRIGAYLAAWSHRLDLLDPAAPAFQHSSITKPTREDQSHRHRRAAPRSGDAGMARRRGILAE